MGVLPFEYLPGESATSLGLTGKETFDIPGAEDAIVPGAEMTVIARADDGKETVFKVKSRIDTGIEAEYYRHGGLLPYVLRDMMGTN
jgi:aconitate hydratase